MLDPVGRLDRDRLQDILDEHAFRRDSYDLYGGHLDARVLNDCVVLDECPEGWVVFYFERGSEYSPKVLKSEDEACLYLLRKLEQDKDAAQGSRSSKQLRDLILKMFAEAGVDPACGYVDGGFEVDLRRSRDGEVMFPQYSAGPSKMLALVAAEQRWLVEEVGSGSVVGKTYVDKARIRIDRFMRGGT